jgi:hypothetical protein
MALVVVALACSDKPIGPPAGDNNYDDPDDPGDPGQGSGGPDGAVDAYGQFCVAARDCPAVFVCAYPIADMCGAAGRCLPYAPDGGCEGAGIACGCTNMPVVLCAPEGYAPAPVQSVGACDAGTVDAGSDASDGATTDADTNDADASS